MRKNTVSRFAGLLLGSVASIAFFGVNAASSVGKNRGSAGTLKFELFDSYGRKVCSTDYTGVPVFLEFGACW